MKPAEEFVNGETNRASEQLLEERRRLLNRCSALIEQLHQIRGKARDDALVRQTTGESEPREVFLARKARIAEVQRELMQAQEELGAVNGRIRNCPDITMRRGEILPPPIPPPLPLKPAFCFPPRVVLESFFQLAKQKLAASQFDSLLRNAEAFASSARKK